MKFLTLKLNKTTQILLSLLLVLGMLFLASCGPQPNKLQLDDQEAAVKATGRLQGEAVRIDNRPIRLPENSDQNSNKNPNQQTQSPTTEVEINFVDYKNVEIEANFDTDIIRVNFDVVFSFLPNQPKQSVVLEGRIEDEGQNRGFANLHPVATKIQDGTSVTPPIVGKARCIESCDRMVLDIITKDQNGKVKSEQFEVATATRVQNGQTTKIDIHAEEESPELTQADSTEDNTQTEDLKDNEIEVNFDDAGTNGVPGAYAQATMTTESIAPLVQSIVQYGISLMSSKDQEKAKETLTQIPPPPSRGDDVVIIDDSSTPSSDNLFPYQLGFGYEGKAIQFYYSYCEIPVKNQEPTVQPARADKKRNPCIVKKRKIFNGAIDKASELLPQSTGVLSTPIDREDFRYYGSGLLIKYLHEAGKKYDQKFPKSSFRINDISQQFGGPIWSLISKGQLAHAAHQNGLEADILLAVKDKRFDTEKNWELVKILVDLGYVHIIYTDKQRIQEFCNFARKTKSEDGKTEFEKYYDTLRRLQHWDHHATHMHLRLKCTPHNPSCRQDRVDPIRAKPECK